MFLAQDTTKSYRFVFFFLLPPTEQKCPRVSGGFSLSMGMKVKVFVTRWCSNLCVLVNRSLSGSSVHGILQARILEWVPIPFVPGDLPNPGIEPRSPALQMDSLPAEPPEKPKMGRVLGITTSLETKKTVSFQRISIGILKD